jgi:hypothetical protein
MLMETPDQHRQRSIFPEAITVVLDSESVNSGLQGRNSIDIPGKNSICQCIEWLEDGWDIGLFVIEIISRIASEIEDQAKDVTWSP